jgi:hypothetical protein
MFDSVFCTEAIERMAAEPGGRAGSALRHVGELDSVVGEDDLNPVRHDGDKGLQEEARGLGIGLVDQLSDPEFRGAVDRDEEVELSWAVCTSAMSTVLVTSLDEETETLVGSIATGG